MTNDDAERRKVAEMERQGAEAAAREAAARAAAEKQAQEDQAAVTRGLTDQATMQQLSSSGNDAKRRCRKN